MQISLEGNKELIDAINKFSQPLNDAFWVAVGTDLKRNLQKNIQPHNKTERLYRNIFKKKIKNGTTAGVLDNGVLVDWKGMRINYGIFLNNGTAPHKICAKNKKSLRWVSGNGFAFAKCVEHPGTKAVNFINNSANATFSNLDNILNKIKG